MTPEGRPKISRPVLLWPGSARNLSIPKTVENHATDVIAMLSFEELPEHPAANVGMPLRDCFLVIAADPESVARSTVRVGLLPDHDVRDSRGSCAGGIRISNDARREVSRLFTSW